MKTIHNIQTCAVWFARWAKTPWAVFNSLCRVVHIQFMNISAFRNSLLQQKGVVRDALLLFLMQESSLGDEEKELPDGDFPHNELILFVLNTNSDIAAAFAVVLSNTFYFIPTYFAKSKRVGIFVL